MLLNAIKTLWVAAAVAFGGGRTQAEPLPKFPVVCNNLSDDVSSTYKVLIGTKLVAQNDCLPITTSHDLFPEPECQYGCDGSYGVCETLINVFNATDPSDEVDLAYILMSCSDNTNFNFYLSDLNNFPTPACPTLEGPRNETFLITDSIDSTCPPSTSPRPSL